MKLSKKYIIKIPKDIKIIYYKQKNKILILGNLQSKLIKLTFDIFFCNQNHIIYVTKNFNNNFNLVQKKKIKALRNTCVSLIKQSILESSILINKKLNLVGVGYRVFLLNENNLLHFRLGFSHSIYYKIPQDIKIIIPKSTSIYIFGNSIKTITQLAADLRSYKKPEFYKGKGILYENEKIILKQGKKI